MERPLLLLACAFVLGAALEPGLSRWWASGLCVALAALLALLAVARPEGARLSTAGLLVAAWGLGGATGAVERSTYESNGLRRWAVAHDGEDRPVRLWGRAVEDLLPDGARRSVLVDVDRLESGREAWRAVGRLRLEVGGAAPLPDWRQGDEVCAWALVRLPRGLSVPGVTPSADRERRRRVHALGFAKSALLLERVAPGRGLVARLASLRAVLRTQLLRHVPAGAEQALARAMLLGERAALDDGVEEAFRSAGTLHVLAISGAQVAWLAGWLACGAARAGAGRLGVAALTLVLLPGYALLVGGEVPVARAALTAVVAAWGLSLDLRANAANLLAAAALALVAERPGCAQEAGFQLSFVATLGLIALAPRLRPAGRWPLALDLAWAASLAAQLAVAPVLAVQFQRLPLAGLLLNALAVPLSAALLALALACAAAGIVLPWAAGPLGDLTWIAAHWLWKSAELSQAAPWLERDVCAPAAWVLALYAASLVAWSRGSLGTRARVALAVALVALLAGGSPLADGRLHLVLVDVGQGQAAVLVTPGGHVLVVDGGAARPGGADMGRSAVGPYLRALGVGRIDVLALSHAHADHAGGLPYLMRRFRVGEVWEGLAPRNDPQYDGFEAAARGLPRRGVAKGVTWELDGVRVQVVWPAPGRRPARARNDDSLVLVASLGRQAFALTGDVESEVEARLALEAAVVTVPHHGSRTSSTAAWLDGVRPRLALLSAGYRNHFGHPHPEVLARYRERGALLARTDLDGTIAASTDGSSLWLLTSRAGWQAHLR